MTKANNEYWRERLNEVAQTLFETTSEEMENKTNKLYDRMTKQIVSKVDDLYYKLLEEGVNTNDIWTYKRYKSILRQISAIVAKLGVQEIDILNEYLEKALKESYSMSNIPNEEQFTMLNEATVKQLIATPWSDKHFSQTVWDNKQILITTLRTELEKCIVLGDSKYKAISAIKKACNTSRSNAERVVRTELMNAINEGQKSRYKASGYTKLKRLACTDSRTCSKCSERNGEILDIDSPEAILLHPRCRDTFTPVLNSKVSKRELS